MERGNPVPRPLKYSLLVIGIILAIADVYLIKKNLDFLETAERTQGRISKIRQHSYSPTIEYRAGGKTYIYEKDHWYGGTPDYKIGDGITMLYPKSNPSDATIYSFTDIWLTVTIVSAFAFLLILFGLILPVRRNGEMAG